MKRKETQPSPAPDLQALHEELTAVRQQLVALEQRVTRLEVQEELWQEPGAAGDEPVR